MTAGPSLPTSPLLLLSLPPILSVLSSSTNAPRNGVFGSWRPSSTSGGREKVLVQDDDEFEDTTQQRYVGPSNPPVSVPCSMSPSPSLCPSSLQIITSHRLFVVNRGACSTKIWLPPRETSGHPRESASRRIRSGLSYPRLSHMELRSPKGQIC